MRQFILNTITLGVFGAFLCLMLGCWWGLGIMFLSWIDYSNIPNTPA